MSDEEHAVVLLDKAEHGRLSLEEMRWLERWLGRQEQRWPVQLLRTRSQQAAAPERLRRRVRRAIRPLRAETRPR